MYQPKRADLHILRDTFNDTPLKPFGKKLSFDEEKTSSAELTMARGTGVISQRLFLTAVLFCTIAGYFTPSAEGFHLDAVKVVFDSQIR